MHKYYLPLVVSSSITPPVNLAPVRVTYRFAGQQEAVQEGVTLTYLHEDHLGGASLATGSGGGRVGE